MNQRYLDYALYNIWANNRLINDLLAQKDEMLTEELVGSFPSIRATILHIWLAEAGWLSLLMDSRWDAHKVKAFSGTNQELFKAWQSTSEEFKDFIIQADLEKEVQFGSKGAPLSTPAKEIVQTVFNHGSYHRGQVVMMMRQLGVTSISQTDCIAWIRQKERGNS